MGATWVLSAPGGPHVGPMNLAIREDLLRQMILYHSLDSPTHSFLFFGEMGIKVDACRMFQGLNTEVGISNLFPFVYHPRYLALGGKLPANRVLYINGIHKHANMKHDVKYFCTINTNTVMSHGLLIKYLKLWVAHAPGILQRFPRNRLQRKRPVSDPGMHHGMCVTHVP